MAGFANHTISSADRADVNRTGEEEQCHKCEGAGDDGIGICVECNGTGARKYGPKES